MKIPTPDSVRFCILKFSYKKKKMQTLFVFIDHLFKQVTFFWLRKKNSKINGFSSIPIDTNLNQDWCLCRHSKLKSSIDLSGKYNMVAYFCHHLSDNYIDLSDLYVVLSDLYVDLSDLYVDFSLIHLLGKKS